MTALATTLQAFFTDRLARQRQVSPNTLAAYRDTLRLLLVFAANKKDKEPSKLDIDRLWRRLLPRRNHSFGHPLASEPHPAVGHRIPINGDAAWRKNPRSSTRCFTRR